MRLWMFGLVDFGFCVHFKCQSLLKKIKQKASYKKHEMVLIKKKKKSQDTGEIDGQTF
jgi:hypothetical protein